MDYLYDGSFDGLLTCIYHNYYLETADGVYLSDSYQPSILSTSRTVVTDPCLASRVYKAIEDKLSEESLHNIYHAFLSQCPDKENIILDYVRFGFRIGSRIDSYHTHPKVQPLHKMARKVTLEVHRFLGLLRFADNGRFLHARVAPDHNILTMLADHFAERLKNERWVIEDEKRNLAAIYDGPSRPKRSRQRHWYIIFIERPLEYSEEVEDPYQELWKLYFSRITIDSRRNPKLQTQFVPKRYRKNLLEFEPLLDSHEVLLDE